MGFDNVPLIAFNRGIISRLALARNDIKRTAMSAEIETNWIPRVLGSMMLRPGLGFIDTTRNNALCLHSPFIYSSTDTAILEFSANILRVRVSEAIISRVSVSSAVTNGAFNTDLSGWTDNDESGAVSAWAAGGYMSLVGTKFNAAIRTQQVTVSGGDANKEHALRLVVARGGVILRVGSTSGTDNYIAETTLSEGAHSLAFTPAGNFFIWVASRTQYATLLDSCTVEAAGAMELPTVYDAANIYKVRGDQSADVVYLACAGQQQYKIERRGTKSWSIVKYQPVDGPFRIDNLTPTTLAPSALTGDITLTASTNYFKSTHIGALFRVTGAGQNVGLVANGGNQFSNAIKVTGVNITTNKIRDVFVTITGTWVATVTLQISYGTPGAWVDFNAYTTNQANLRQNDGLDNQINYFRIGIKTGDYTSGTATITLTSAAGSILGIARVTAYTSPTVVNASVLQDFGVTTASDQWAEGDWSPYRGYPSAVALDEGRLWWVGKNKVWASISDAYESFDDTQVGDAGPINRSIGSGPVDTINWLLPLQRLVMGTDIREISIRSSSFDEVLTPSNFNLKTTSTQGSNAVTPLVLDETGLYVRRSGKALMRLDFTSDSFYDYKSINMNELCPELCDAGIVRLAVQRQPDTRVHCILNDGKVAVLVSQPAEEVLCWLMVETDGYVEDALVMPGLTEDIVYYFVRRTVNGNTVRYMERWAFENECLGADISKLADSFVHYSGAPATTISVQHLKGKNVVIWADGQDLAGDDPDNPVIFTVNASTGNVTLPVAASEVTVGLYYEARFKSTKLAYAASLSTALTQKKKIGHLGLVLASTHYMGLRFGKNFDLDGDGNYANLDDLPRVLDKGEVVDPDVQSTFDALDIQGITFPGEWDTDSRLCLLAQAPRACTVLAGVIGLKTDDKGLNDDRRR